MARPAARAWGLLLLCSVVLARGGAASSAAACASCKSLLGALQRRALAGCARQLLQGACAARPEAQVRPAGWDAPYAAPYGLYGARILTPRRADQAGPCQDAAAALEEQIAAAFAANPPAALCSKVRRLRGMPLLRGTWAAAARLTRRGGPQAGACSSDFMADLAGLLFEAPPARGELCAACEAAVQKAAAALADATTQGTVCAPRPGRCAGGSRRAGADAPRPASASIPRAREAAAGAATRAASRFFRALRADAPRAARPQLRTSAQAACASLRAPLAAQCAAVVDGAFPAALEAALAHLAEPRAACVALEQCACPMHAALDAEERPFGREGSPFAAGGASVLAPLLLLSSSDDYEDWWHQLWTSTTSSEAFAAFSEIFWSDSSTFVTTSEDGEAAGVRFESVAFLHPRAHGPM